MGMLIVVITFLVGFYAGRLSAKYYPSRAALPNTTGEAE